MEPKPQDVNRVLFVCTGNICRSPLAAALLQHLVQQHNCPRVEVASAGLMALPGNEATLQARQVAAEHGLSLDRHRARVLDGELINWADLILVMEPAHRRLILAAHPEADSKVILLRHFGRHGSRQRAIQDPYGAPLEVYRFCFQDIQECVESFYNWLRCGHLSAASPQDQ